MKITLPFRTDCRFFLVREIFGKGFVIGHSGKVFWFYILDPNSEWFKREKESADSFYYISKKLGHKFPHWWNIFL